MTVIYSGSQGSLVVQNAHIKVVLHEVHIVALAAHWGCRMPRNKYTGMWFIWWLLRLTGDSEDLQGHWFTFGSYSGSYGSLGTQNTSNSETYMTLMYSGSRGSPRTQNDRDYLDLQVAHVVAPRAHWGPRRSIIAQPTWHSCIIHIMAPVAHWGHKILKIATCTWLLHTVAPRAHWGCRMSPTGSIDIWFI